MDAPVAWSVIAVNLPEHAHNAIHTDAGARAAGYPAALVAGVTTYAYLTHPCAAAWGVDWLAHGGGELRLKAPVFEGDRVDLIPTVTTAGVLIEAVCPAQQRNPRATFDAVRDSGPPPPARPGRSLTARQVRLAPLFGLDYGERAGDDLGIYTARGLAHPALWPAIANYVYATDLVKGAWVHTRSIVRHHALVPADAIVDVKCTVVDEFERGGRRAVTDVVIEFNGTIAATVEHEAIVELA